MQSNRGAAGRQQTLREALIDGLIGVCYASRVASRIPLL